MTTKQLYIISVSLMLTIVSCNNNSLQDTNNNDNTATEKISKVDTLRNSNSLPNDKFKKEIISKVTDQKDLIKFDTLLTALDKNNVSFCQFVQRLFLLDDSCYAVAKQKFPDPSQQEAFAKVHRKAIKEAESKYLKSLNLRNDFSTFATVAYNFDQDIKKFCGNY